MPTSLAQTAYAASPTPVGPGRGVDYAAFQSVTFRLSKARGDGTSQLDRAAVLRDNRKLWMGLTSDIADAKNGLPLMTRADLFYLAEFALRHSNQALNDVGALDALIEINTAVMRGLAGQEASI